MSDNESQARWEQIANQPFVPANISGMSGAHATAEYRVAAALEYIAAQLGQISAKLSVLGDNRREGGMR
jgi:hypothetical protein